MLELLSYGNQLFSGKYNLHSKFSSAVNFFSDDNFVFIVNEDIGSGPLNIVIKGIDLNLVNSLLITDTSVIINDINIVLAPDKIYLPAICLYEFDHNNFINNLNFLENITKNLSPAASLGFVLNSQRVLEQSSSYEIEYMKRVNAGVYEILYGNILNGVKLIKGLGPGLTPSGDDFNSGLLISLKLVEKICNSDMKNSISLILQEALGKNLFANAFLICASKGLLFNKFRELINALLYSDENMVLEKTRTVLSIGETSGADQLVGFLTGMKRFLI
jgi:hypothetical protein